MNDKKIAHMLKNSSQKGLCALIEKYRGLVGAIVSRILPGCEEDIEECIADTFLSVWEHRTRLDPGRDTLKSYTACVARNMAIDRYRKLSKVKTIPIEDVELIGELDLTAAVARKQDWIALQKTVLAMPEPDREIFIRRHFLLQPVREIAAAVSMNEKQVKNRLYQSRLKLKKQLIRKGVTL